MSYLVLLSSGLDSTVNLYEARRKGKVKCVLTFDYGQKARKKEILRSKMICKDLKIPHKIISLPFFSFFKSALFKGEVPKGSAINLKDRKKCLKIASKVWVPNRNGIFLHVGAGFAESMGCRYLVVGFNKEEARTFPDNSGAFLKSLNESLKHSTKNKVKAISFTTSLMKKEIAKKGLSLGVDFKKIWPCYLGGSEICLRCESCKRFLKATEGIL